ncbi:VapC toxin protein [Geitlerinema sp. FC II]|nr:VapC toxin protein [Geitlerinema sp. FC II]
MYLLDTNICIALLKNNQNVVESFTKNVEFCYLSSIVVAELYKGVYCSQQVARNLQALEQFVNLLPVLDFDRASALEFGKIQGELRRIGRPTGELDAIIVAVARSRQLILVTDNIKHFKNIANLNVENWMIK